ncbi:MAG: hypothetical protein K5863_20990 [Nitratireductor sp.]|uniref:hypothetical protein n=1 Tax=Nitratireductor sp. TaxID=1872084 RepID=UPI00260B545E|nr:hypothetical protein [Nitratireductor sp.]MCV0352561.1 hypothetical protein [Nitratireductor sp.]
MGNLSAPFLPLAEEIATRFLGPPAFRTHSGLRWGRKGSLSLSLSGRHAGLFYDFEANARFDLIDLVRKEMQLTVADALHWLREETGLRAQEATQSATLRSSLQNEPLIWSDKAEAIWKRTTPPSRNTWRRLPSHTSVLFREHSPPPLFTGLAGSFAGTCREG